MLEDFHVLPLSDLRTHSVRRRDVQQQTHVEKLVSFDALQRSEVVGRRSRLALKESQEATGTVCVVRSFTLYLRTNEQLFTHDFSALVVEEDGRERRFAVNRHNYFVGHVVGMSVGTRVGGSSLVHTASLLCCRRGELPCSGSHG